MYGSFVQSKMYQEGVRCTDCHNPHTARLREPGNAVCTRCHQTSPPEDFPAPEAKDYETEDHHHSRRRHRGYCVASIATCPPRTDMVVDPRRDHSFRIPQPDLSVKLATAERLYRLP